RKHSIVVNRSPAKFRYGCRVRTRKIGKRELSVVVELDEIEILERRISFLGFLWICHVLKQKLAVRFEKRANLVRQRLHRFVRNQPLSIFAPGKRRRQTPGNNRQNQRKREREPQLH